MIIGSSSHGLNLSSSDPVKTLQYQTDAYHVVLVFNSTKVLEMFIMTILLLVTAITGLFLTKWIIALTFCCLRNWLGKSEVRKRVNNPGLSCAKLKPA